MHHRPSLSSQQHLQTIPALLWSAWAQAGWVLGCAAQMLQGQLWLGGAYGGVCALALLGLLGLHRLKHLPAAWRAVQALLALLLLAALGFGSTGWRAASFDSQRLLPQWQGVDVVVQGVVVSLPQATERGQRWRFAVEQAWDSQGQAIQLPPLLGLSHYTDTPGQERLLVQAGERWRWTLRLKSPHGARNPHGFDAELWWWSQGVQATGYVRPQAPATPERLGQTRQAPLEQARAWMRERLQASPGSTRALGVVTALVTGDQAAIDKADWALFRDTGVAHLVSISGLHITMFAWLAVALVGGLWRRSAWLCLRWPAPQAAAWAGLLLATLYALFSGWGIPAQRTLLMLAVVVGLRSLGLVWPWQRVWLLALALVLVWDPWALLQAGFWLSFVAVAMLFLLTPEEAAQIDTDADAATEDAPPPSLPVRLWRSLREMARVQWWLGLALAPLTLLLFGQVSIVGFFTNLWAIPWVTLVLTPLSMLGALWPVLWTAAAWCAQAMLWGLGWMAQWPAAVLYLALPPWWLGALAAVGGLWLLLPWPLWLRGLGLPLLLPAVLWHNPRPAMGQFELLALDIGQGSAILLRTAQHSLLWDAGPRWSATGDAGSQTIVPLLRAQGERLDKLIISHADMDHAGGAASVLAAQPQAQLWGSGIAKLAAEANRSQQWQACAQGQSWQWDGVQFRFLWPDARWLAQYAKPSDTNAQSCVLHIQAQDGRSALLTGDMEAAQELALLSQGQVPRADVLLVAHHGSKTSTTSAWLQAVQPRVAIVQSGWRNRFGHPAPIVVQRIEQQGSLLRNTADCGAVAWQSSAPAQAPCERQLRPRYWQALLD